ncbi:hypothetical protein [Halobacillus sp. A5]|uniref:hypothetical protein n=1 Tax=Halobacillus sp. A5 TaxID=2880263 RepID=UPI0020A66B7F|nr:hypothetical protein [Halobacillus sp. A5]MCP3028503.1 hypothetical protein [Halobacillus sp. A5]
MKWFTVILWLLPVPFFFHLYEYQSYIHREEAIFLMEGFLLITIIAGVWLIKWPPLIVLILGIGMTLLSLGLGAVYIPNDTSWFKPVGRNGAIIFTAVIYIAGMMIIKGVCQGILNLRFRLLKS